MKCNRIRINLKISLWKSLISYSVSFGEDSNNQIKYAIYPSNTTDLNNLWQSLNNDIGREYGQLVLLKNITSSNTSSSSTSTSSLTSNLSIITTANTPSPVAITFDYNLPSSIRAVSMKKALFLWFFGTCYARLLIKVRKSADKVTNIIVNVE